MATVLGVTRSRILIHCLGIDTKQKKHPVLRSRPTDLPYTREFKDGRDGWLRPLDAASRNVPPTATRYVREIAASSRGAPTWLGSLSGRLRAGPEPPPSLSALGSWSSSGVLLRGIRSGGGLGKVLSRCPKVTRARERGRATVVFPASKGGGGLFTAVCKQYEGDCRSQPSSYP